MLMRPPRHEAHAPARGQRAVQRQREIGDRGVAVALLRHGAEAERAPLRSGRAGRSARPPARCAGVGRQRLRRSTPPSARSGRCRRRRRRRGFRRRAPRSEMSLSATPKSPRLGRLSARAANFSAPNARPGPRAISFRLAPIISSAMLFEVSLRGSHSATNLPPRRIVAVSQSAMISCSLCEM